MSRKTFKQPNTHGCQLFSRRQQDTQLFSPCALAAGGPGGVVYSGTVPATFYGSGIHEHTLKSPVKSPEICHAITVCWREAPMKEASTSSAVSAEQDVEGEGSACGRGKTVGWVGYVCQVCKGEM